MFLHVCKRTFRISKVRLSLRVMQNMLCYNAQSSCYWFFMKINVLLNFHICVGVPLNIRSIFLVQTSFSSMLIENDRNLIVGKVFLTYEIITDESRYWEYWEYKEIFSYISFSRLFFSFNNVVLLIKWSAHTALRFLHKKWLWT